MTPLGRYNIAPQKKIRSGSHEGERIAALHARRRASGIPLGMRRRAPGDRAWGESRARSDGVRVAP